MEGDRFFYLMVVVIALIGVGLFAIPVRAHGNSFTQRAKPPVVVAPGEFVPLSGHRTVCGARQVSLGAISTFSGGAQGTIRRFAAATSRSRGGHRSR